MLQAGVSQLNVARGFGVNPSQINRLLIRHRETGTVKDRPRSGRPKVTTLRQDRYIRFQHLRNRFRTAVETAAGTIGYHGRPINEHTVRRRLQAAGMKARRPVRAPILSEANRINRLRWAQGRQRWTRRQWGSILWSDESRFCCSVADGRLRVWRRKGERYRRPCVLEFNRWGGPSCMVWAGITAEHKTDLVVVAGNLTARRYLDEIIIPHVIPFLAAHPETRLFQHDNARPHSAAITRDFLEENEVTVLPWVPYSPDLNPIEHLWDELGRRVLAREPHNRISLIRILQEEWERIPQQQVRNLINSMRGRCTECIEARGGHTHY